MSRYSRLMRVAQSTTPERLERCEQVLYPYAARGMQSGRLLDSQLERLLKTLSERSGVGVRSITKAYRAVAKANPERHKGAEQAGQYLIEGGAICHQKDTFNGPVTAPLCNFTARIIEERERDDGLERTLVLALTGELANGTKLPVIEVSASQFAAMNWPVSEWGSRAVVYAGQGTKDHLRTAIQMLSGDVSRRATYTHLGWREVDGKMCFLHAGGALGPDGAVAGVQVDPPQGLEPFTLPTPPEDLRDAVRSSFATLDLAADAITVPLLGSAYRAVLGGVDFGLHLAGQTGAGKSELAAVMQQHYGPGLDARHLPGSWSSTANALEGLAFSAKDVLTVIDDFAPEGSSHDVARYHATAARLFRAQGNSAARGRMRADGSLRAPRPPRGMVLSTGEDIPKGHSIKARTLILELEPGALDWGRVSAAQRLASSGIYAAALAGFIRWLAKDYEGHLATFRSHHERYREQLQQRGHKRTVDVGAQLLAAWRTVLTFALEVDALTAAEQAELWRRVNAGMRAALEPQASYQAQSDPVARFGELLSGLFTSGRAHVADATTGECPGDGWGWEAYEVGSTFSGFDTRHRAKGNRIGWLDGEDLYLEPAATYAELQRFARDQGESVPVTETVLWKRLHERSLILSREAPHMTVKRSLAGAGRKRVLHLDPSYVEQSGASGAYGVSAVQDGSKVCPTFETQLGQRQKVGQAREPQLDSAPQKSGAARKSGALESAFRTLQTPHAPQNTGVEGWDRSKDLLELYTCLRDALERGAWPIPHAAALLNCYRCADEGDEEARAKIATYLEDPDVVSALQGNLQPGAPYRKQPLTVRP